MRNNLIHIPCAPKDWCVASGAAKDEFSPSFAQSVVYSLSGVFLAFSDIFGENVLSQNPNLLVLNDTATPHCERTQGMIFLDTSGNYPQQHVYQFSHELTHYIIRKAICADYRWLEETFCELMSWCVLSWVYEHRNADPLHTIDSVYNSIPNYIENLKNECVRLPNGNIAGFIADNKNVLRVNCYEREINRTIVKSMYPLFKKHKDLWNVIFSLPSLRNGMELGQALHTLCDNASLPNELAKTLISLFLE